MATPQTNVATQPANTATPVVTAPAGPPPPTKAALKLNAYVRLLQPDTPSSTSTDSSYLRLGGNAANETDLVTGLKTTRSENSEESVSAISQAKVDGVNSSLGQKTEKVSSSVKETFESNNEGVLLYTNYDFQTHAKGMVLTKIGKGHNTEVTTQDAVYAVKAGTYKMYGENGVSVIAGSGGTPANITLEASNYISQTAKGPLSEITYGHSEKRTIGNAMEFFLGTKFTCMIGAETKLNLVTTISSFIGASFTFKLAFEFSLNAVGSITIKFFGTNSLHIGSKLEIIVGNDFKQVTGTSTKIVVGADCKLTTEDTKVVLGNDMKLAIVGDLKKVGINGTMCEVDIKKVTAKVDDELLKVLTSNFTSKMEQMSLDCGGMQAVTKSAVLHL